MDFCWSVWLIPHNKIIGHYRKLVNHFCEKYNSPMFEPHVTLFGSIDIDPQATFTFFRKIISQYSYINLSPRKIETGESPWKSLTIKLKMEPSLQKFQNMINHEFQAYKKYIFDPHLSLAYGDIKINENDLNSFSLDETICFSSVALVSTPNQIDDWRIIKKFKLNGIN